MSVVRWWVEFLRLGVGGEGAKGPFSVWFVRWWVVHPVLGVGGGVGGPFSE